MNSTSTEQPIYPYGKPKHAKLYLQKQVVISVGETLSFNKFKKNQMKKRPDESNDNFECRCVDVWNILCEGADNTGVIQFENEEIDDDDERYDFEAELEEKLEEAIEEVDEANEEADDE